MSNVNNKKSPDELNPSIVTNLINKFQTAHAADVSRYTKEAFNWFRIHASKTTKIDRDKFVKSPQYAKRHGTEGNSLVGKLYMFKYKAVMAGDAETGLYDQYPMVFFFGASRTKDGHTVFHGLNLHYLTPVERLQMFVSLLKLKTSKKFLPKTRLRLEWEAIKAVANNQMVERAVHAYRLDRFETQLNEVPANAWGICIFLQLQKWAKPSGEKVLQSSAKKHITKNAQKAKKSATVKKKKV